MFTLSLVIVHMYRNERKIRHGINKYERNKHNDKNDGVTRLRTVVWTSSRSTWTRSKDQDDEDKDEDKDEVGVRVGDDESYTDNKVKGQEDGPGKSGGGGGDKDRMEAGLLF